MGWLEFVESAGNRLLSLDPDLLDQLQPYYGKLLRIELIEPNLTIDFQPCPDGFIISEADENEADVSLRGSLWAFVRLAKEGAHSDVFEAGRITMTGDAELGQSFQGVLAGLDIDWEELTSKLVGDMAARNMHRLFGESRSWFSQSRQHFRENTGELIQEELKAAPAKVEVDVLHERIETLRSDVSRLEVRIQKLISEKEKDSENA